MKVWKLFEEENRAIGERYELSVERIGAMGQEETTKEPYRSYFRSMAAFVGMIEELVREIQNGVLENGDLKKLAQWNRRLYEDVAGDAYENSYANPAVAAERLGETFGPMLSYLYTELRGAIVYAFEQRLTDITIGNELLIQIYNLFEEGEP